MQPAVDCTHERRCKVLRNMACVFTELSNIPSNSLGQLQINRLAETNKRYVG